jgi:membrane protein DedA with SNARE-associated domain
VAAADSPSRGDVFPSAREHPVGRIALELRTPVSLAEYIIFFVLVVSTGAGVPVLGDAAMIAAGTLAGEGRLNIGVVLVLSIAGWMLGSLLGYVIGLRGGRRLLERPGRMEKRRRKILAKGDQAFAAHKFGASVTMPAYLSGIFRVRFPVFMLGALVAGSFFIVLYIGISYFLGAEVAERIGDAGSKAVLGVLVIVAIGLGIRAGWSRWRAREQPSAKEQAGRP